MQLYILLLTKYKVFILQCSYRNILRFMLRDMRYCFLSVNTYVIVKFNQLKFYIMTTLQ